MQWIQVNFSTENEKQATEPWLVEKFVKMITEPSLVDKFSKNDVNAQLLSWQANCWDLLCQILKESF